MTAHIAVPALDNDGVGIRPATFSPALIDGILRRDFGFNGLVFSDALSMGAVANAYEPGEAAVFEDALAGVAAGRAGGFGFVVGVDRAGDPDGLRRRGADIVVSDLSELLERPDA